MKLVFEKSDMAIVPRWTDNINDEWINPFIVQCCELNFRDTISKTLYDAMANAVALILTGAQGNAWVDQVYTSGSVVLYNEVYYKAVAAVIQGEAAPDANTNWAVYELVNFWAEFAKPYLVYHAYKSFLLWHGSHIAQGGLRVHFDNTSNEVTAEGKAPLLQDTRNTISIKQIKLMNDLTAKEYTYDGVKYATNENVKPANDGLQIFAI